MNLHPVPNPQGDIDKATTSLDEVEATFMRRPPTVDDALAQRLAGTYESRGGKFQVVIKPGSGLCPRVQYSRLRNF